MNKKITEHGDDLVIVVEKALLKKLNMSKNNISMDMSIEGNSLLIRVHKADQDESEDKEINKIGDEILEEYKSVFDKLSKS